MIEHPRPLAHRIVPQPVMEGAGVRLRRSTPTRALGYLDPFLLFDDFSSDDPNDYRAGFPMHPHRGIETVTYVRSGVVKHRDTLGNAGSIAGGEVQWMTAGCGIMHEEMPQPGPGPLIGFQLWVNLPARDKMTHPRYQGLTAAEIPVVRRADGATVHVIAGEVDGVPGPVREIVADPTYLDIHLPPEGLFAQAVPAGHNAFAYIYEGEGEFDGEGARYGERVGHPGFVVFGDGDGVRVRASEPGARLLLASGRPSHEPIVRYGPFVMNTEAEIEQALRDLRNGTFVRG